MSKEDTRGNALKMQNAIRHNADEVSSMLSSLGKWEKKMKLMQLVYVFKI